MSIRRVATIAHYDLLILRRDPVWLLMIGMPLLLTAFAKPAFQAALIASGERGANGAEQAVPGMAVLFSFFLSAVVGMQLYRDHGWHTWDRLRASPAAPVEILLGKLLPPLCLALFQLLALFGLGVVLFELQVAGSWWALGAVGISLALCTLTLGLAIAATTSSILQVNALANLSALLLAGLGGAVTPSSTLPSWAAYLAPASPGHWAMRGFQEVIVGAGGLAEVVVPVAVLLAFCGVFCAVAAHRLRFDERKVSWA